LRHQYSTRRFDALSRKAYEAPTVRVVGSLSELTLLIQKQNNNTPDGYAYHGVILTS
jgi:hypothetical protein